MFFTRKKAKAKTNLGADDLVGPVAESRGKWIYHQLLAFQTMFDIDMIDILCIKEFGKKDVDVEEEGPDITSVFDFDGGKMLLHPLLAFKLCLI
jgi:hypothetical protein